MDYALITGASKGIGKAIAVELANRKHNLILIARTEALLRQLCVELNKEYGVTANYFVIDLSLPGADKKIFTWCRQNEYSINILVNNAGYGLSGLFESHSKEDNAAMLQVNMITLVQLCQTFLPLLKQQPRSYILNIASTAAFQAVPLLNLYAASKAFVLSFSRSLAYELKGSSVSVTCINPGATDTDFPNRAMMNEKTKKNAEKLNMSPTAVAGIAVEAMFAGRREVTTGFINKLGSFFVWLLPKSLVEKTAANIYK